MEPDDIKIISYPRSGHHLLERILYNIFIKHNLDYTYCEPYTHCKKKPCRDKRLFQKDHWLENKYHKQQKMIVLYRKDYIYQLEAYFRFENQPKYNNFKQKLEYGKYRMNTEYIYNKSLDYSNKNIFKNLLRFIKKQKPGYENWKNKIIENDFYEKRIIIEYYDFLENPKKYIKEILNLYDSNLLYDESLIEEAIEEQKIIKNNKKLDNNTYVKIKEHFKEN